jgi:hypothetical protein
MIKLIMRSDDEAQSQAVAGESREVRRSSASKLAEIRLAGGLDDGRPNVPLKAVVEETQAQHFNGDFVLDLPQRF